MFRVIKYNIEERKNSILEVFPLDTLVLKIRIKINPKSVRLSEKYGVCIGRENSIWN